MTPLHDQIFRGEVPFRWQHVDLTEPAVKSWLDAAGVPEPIVDTLVREDTRPRVLSFAAGLALNLRSVNANPGADPEDMVALRVWLTSDRVLSGRLRRVQAIDDFLAVQDSGMPLDRPGVWLVQLLTLITDRIGEQVERYDDALYALEEQVETLDSNRRVLALRRDAAATRRFLLPQREALETLLRIDSALLNDTDRFAVREQSDRLSRFLEDLELMRERALVLQEQLLNRVAQLQNQRAYVLSLVATVFLPLGFVTGLFGVNLGGMPGTDQAHAFLWLCVTLVVGAVCLLLVLRWRRWL
ncbi:MAG: zinc transporter ZntB [Pseudomonadota bacterium]